MTENNDQEHKNVAKTFIKVRNKLVPLVDEKKKKTNILKDYLLKSNNKIEVDNTVFELTDSKTRPAITEKWLSNFVKENFNQWKTPEECIECIKNERISLVKTRKKLKVTESKATSA